jgi:hypothetical protein
MVSQSDFRTFVRDPAQPSRVLGVLDYIEHGPLKFFTVK